MKNNKGFTIIEVVLSFAFAIVIIASMFVIVINYQNRTEKEKLISNMKNYKNGILEIVYQDIISSNIESMETCGSKCLKINTKSNDYKLEAKIDDESNAYISYKNNNYVLPDSKYDLSEIGDFSYQIDANNKIYKIEIPIIHAELTSEENDENTIKILVSGKEFDKEVNKLDNPTKVITDDITYDGVIHELVTINKLKGNIYYSLTTELNRSNYKTGSTEIPKGRDVDEYTIYYYVEESSDYLAKSGSSVIKINPRLVTFSVDYISKAYDAKVLSQDKVSLISGSLANGHRASFKVSGQITDAGSTTSVLEKVAIYDGNNNDVTSNYSITKVNGTLTVNKRPITVIASSASKVYDANALTKPSGCESASNLVSGHTATCTNTGSIINAGSTTNTLSNVVIKNGNTDVTRNYNITKQNGKLTISKRMVTYKADDATKVYDGSALTKNTATLTSGSLVSGHSASFTIDGTITNAGTVTNTLKSVIIKNSSGTNVSNNYDITRVNGTLTITRKSVTIPTASNYCNTGLIYNGKAQTLTKTAGTGYTFSGNSKTNAGSYTVTATLNGNYKWSDNTTGNKTFTCSIGKKSATVTASSASKTYDGSALTKTSGCASSVGLISGHTSTCTNAGSITNAGSTTNTLSSVVIKNGNTDVTSNYNITKQNGTLTISKRAVTYKADDATKVYDGNVLTKNTATLKNGSLVSGHSATFTIDGTITNVGSVTNTLKNVVIKNGSTDVTSNYNITKQNGTLTVTRKGVTIPTANNYCNTGLTYNGKTQTLTKTAGMGYSFSGNYQVNAGTYPITASLNGNYQWNDNTTGTKTFNCSIDKKSATVTASSASKTYDGSALTKTSGCAGTSNLVSGHTATCTNTGSITNVGSTTNTLSSVVIKNGNTDVTSNYNITKQNGTLTVTRKGVTIPTANNYCNTGLTYNGKTQTLTKTAGMGYSFSGNYQVNAGTYPITASLNGNYQWNDNTTGTKTFNCSIDKKSATVTASSASKTYDGSALTKTSGCASSVGLVSGHTATCTNTGSITNVGSTTNTLSSVVIKNGNTDVTSNYNIIKQTGTLTITRKGVTIPTANNYCNTGLTYNGKTQTLTKTAGTGYTFSDNSKTNAGSYTITATLNGNYKWSDNTTGTKTFTCSINKKAVTYKANDASKAYDGTELTAKSATLTSGSLVSGHTATFNITGGQTSVGSSTNTLNSVTIKSGNTDVSSNYNIKRQNGTLTITDSVIPKCTFDTWSASSLNVDEQASIILTCNDKESGLATTSLTINNFTISNTSSIKITNVTSEKKSGDEVKFTITISAQNTSGDATISLNDSVVSDVSGNSNNKVTSPKITVLADKTGPSIKFGTDGNSKPSRSHSTSINVEDDSKITEIKYLWSQNSSASASSGTSTSNNAILSKENADDNWYLCVYAKDEYGNTTNTCSKKFVLDNTKPVISGNSTACVLWGSDFNIDNYLSVSDTNNVTKSVSGTVNTTKTGSYTITLTAKDDANNESSKAITVYVYTKIIENSSSGISNDQYLSNRHIYRGDNPDNHVVFNNSSNWRIVAINPDGTYKLVYMSSIGDMQFNGSKTNSFANSSLATYLNGTYYNSLSSEAKNYIVSSSYYYNGNFGAAAKGSSMQTDVNLDRSSTYTGNVALLSASDYILASTNNNCTNYYYSYNKVSGSYPCSLNNYLYKSSGSYWWIMNGHTNGNARLFGTTDAALKNNPATNSYAVYPVVTLKNTTTFTGSGTSSDPYRICTTCSGASSVTCSVTTSSGYDTSKTLTINPSGSVSAYSWDGINWSSSSTKTISQSGTFTGYIKDATGKTNSCNISIKSRTEYRSRSCSTTPTFGNWSSGTAKYNSETCSALTKDTYRYRCSGTYKAVCTYDGGSCGESKALESLEDCHSWCRTQQSDVGSNIGTITCKCYTGRIYETRSCTCPSWGSYGGWSTTQIEPSCRVEVESRVAFGE